MRHVGRSRSVRHDRRDAIFLRAPKPPRPVNGYGIEIISPISGASFRIRRPAITVKPVSVLNDPVDVQIQWWPVAPYLAGSPAVITPTPTYDVTTVGLVSGGQFALAPPADLSYGAWWYRVRAGNSTTGIWGAWTGLDRHLNVTPVLGSVAQYIDANIGVQQAAQQNAIAYLDMNVGVAAPAPRPAVDYLTMNVGVAPVWLVTALYADMNVYPPTIALTTARYTDMNVLAGARPTPHIWWIRPEQGREGYVFHLYGHGFGGFQNEWDGKVLLGALICPVVRWERITALDPPDQIVRADDPINDVRDPEHGWITVVVPVNAISGMVKVILEGGA